MSDSLPPTARSLPIALIRARETVMAPIRHMLADSGITEQQWRVLRVLEEAGPLDGATLAMRACLLPPSLTRIVQSMAERGLVQQSNSETDRRRSVVAITSDGVALIAANQPQAAEIAQSYKAKLGPERFDTLLDLLDVLGSDEPATSRK